MHINYLNNVYIRTDIEKWKEPYQSVNGLVVLEGKEQTVLFTLYTTDCVQFVWVCVIKVDHFRPPWRASCSQS